MNVLLLSLPNKNSQEPVLLSEPSLKAFPDPWPSFTPQQFLRTWSVPATGQALGTIQGPSASQQKHSRRKDRPIIQVLKVHYGRQNSFQVYRGPVTLHSSVQASPPPWKTLLPLTSGVGGVTLQKPVSHRQGDWLGASGSVSCRRTEDQDWVFAA